MLLTLLRRLVDTYTMFPAVVLSDSTKVRALGSGVEVYKSMENPGGKAIVSNGKLSVCPITREDKHRSETHSSCTTLLFHCTMFFLRCCASQTMVAQHKARGDAARLSKSPGI